MLELGTGRRSAAAVAHLFRHLNDVDALQRNPLARPWFEDLETGCVDPARARSAVRELRRLVLEGLEVAVSADLAQNRDRRALRQQAIFKKLYFEGLARKRAARELGISMRQLHRERSHICERIAAYVSSHRPSSPSQPNGINFNVREYELERAQTAAEADLTDAALAILMGMLAPSSSWSDEPDVAITLADVAVSCGDFQLARHGLNLAEVRLGRLRSKDARDALLIGRVLLITAKLLRAQGELDNARQALNQALDIANRPALCGREWARLSTEIALERAMDLADKGLRKIALETLNAALNADTQIALVPLTTRAELQIEAALLTSKLRRSGECDGEPNERALDDLYAALLLARRCGSSRLIIRAMLGIAEHFMHMRRVRQSVRGSSPQRFNGKELDEPASPRYLAVGCSAHHAFELECHRATAAAVVMAGRRYVRADSPTGLATANTVARRDRHRDNLLKVERTLPYPAYTKTLQQTTRKSATPKRASLRCCSPRPLERDN